MMLQICVKQWEISDVIVKYCEEGKELQMKEKFWKLFFWLRSLIRSVKLINKIHLMDHVWYQGKEYVINNGTRNPIWDLSPVERDADGRCPSIFVHEKDFKKPFWRNIKNSALSNHNWYMMYWFQLDVRKKTLGY